jgi:hypothetical protein
MKGNTLNGISKLWIEKISAADLKNSADGWLKIQLDQPCPLVYSSLLCLYSCQALRGIE